MQPSVSLLLYGGILSERGGSLAAASSGGTQSTPDMRSFQPRTPASKVYLKPFVYIYIYICRYVI